LLRTLAVTLFMVFLIVGAGIPLILYSAVRGSVTAMYRVGMAGFRFAFRLGGIRVHASGLENIPAGTCIFAANHASNLDPPAIAIMIPRRISLLAKEELFRIPIMGSALRLADVVPVERSKPGAAIASVDHAVRHLKAGISFVVFPEGTRSLDGRVRPFKKGSFAMAIEAGVQVVPVSVAGTQRLLRKGSWRIERGDVRVRFGRPVDSSRYTKDQRADLTEEVERIVIEGLPPEQKPLADNSEAG
jgi:1-acyl-sn-glycerol-3-phosphate acyltransferase